MLSTTNFDRNSFDWCGSSQSAAVTHVDVMMQSNRQTTNSCEDQHNNRQTTNSCEDQHNNRQTTNYCEDQHNNRQTTNYCEDQQNGEGSDLQPTRSSSGGRRESQASMESYNRKRNDIYLLRLIINECGKTPTRGIDSRSNQNHQIIQDGTNGLISLAMAAGGSSKVKERCGGKVWCNDGRVRYDVLVVDGEGTRKRKDGELHVVKPNVNGRVIGIRVKGIIGLRTGREGSIGGCLCLTRPVTLGHQWWIRVKLYIPPHVTSLRPGCLIGSDSDDNQHILISLGGVRANSAGLFFGLKSKGTLTLARPLHNEDFLCRKFVGWQTLDVVCWQRRQIFILGGDEIALTEFGKFCCADVRTIGNSFDGQNPIQVVFSDLTVSDILPDISQLLTSDIQKSCLSKPVD